MRKWLVTGGAGFIGSHVAADLRKRGERVVVLDNLETGTRENLRFAAPDAFVRGDIRDAVVVRRAMRGVTHVLHQAALRSVPRSLADPLSTDSVNVGGTLNLLLAASRAGVKRFVSASSSSVYGDGRVFPQRESFPTAPISPYAVSKVAGEYYCAMFAKTYGLPTVSLRYFNVFGPRQDPKSRYAVVVPKFILAALRGGVLEVHDDGRQSRDFTYIDNVVQANRLAALRPLKGPAVYNVAVGATHSVLDIVRVIEKTLGVTTRRRHAPRRRGDVRKTYASIDAIQRDLGYRPSEDFESGLRKTIAYFQGVAR
jgi:UDP-glucose 4-epimerase